MLFTDAFFANAGGYKLQLEFLILLADDKNISKYLHSESVRRNRVAHSVLAAELHTPSLVYDNACVLRELETERFVRQICLEAYAYSRTLLDMVGKYS